MKNQAIKNFIVMFSLVVFLGSAHIVSAAYPDWDYQASYRSKPSAFTVLSLTADQVGNTTGNTQTTGYNPYSYGTNGSTTTTSTNGYQTQTTGYNSNGQPIINNYYYPNPSTSSTKVATTTTTKSTTSTANTAKSNTSSSTSNNAKLASASAFNSPTNNPNAYAGMNTGASGFSNTSGSNGFSSTRSNNGLTALSLGGSGSFMPSSLWQWIIVILLILIIIVIIRIISRRDDTHVVHH